MRKLYITGTGPSSGKTALAVTLGLHFQEQGHTVCWYKPVSTTVTVEDGRLLDEDALFVRDVLGLSQDPVELAPVALTPETLRDLLRGGDPNRLDDVVAGFENVSEGADVGIIEGGTNLAEGTVINANATRVADALDAKVLAVTSYASMLVLDELIYAHDAFGDRMIGGVINAIRSTRMEFIDTIVRENLKQRGIHLVAALPREKLLAAVTIAELNEVLNGEVLTARDKMDQLVENLSVGAMSVDSALTYFRRQPNKAVITGGDRSDIQMAALETSTRCLILTGNLQPRPMILTRAEERGVPIILVRHDTLTTVEIAENQLGKVRFHQEQKLERFRSLVDEHFDLEYLGEAL